MSFVETALAFKSKLRAASPCGYYGGPEHECFRICTSRPMGPTNPAFSRNSKPPPLGGGGFTLGGTNIRAAIDRLTEIARAEAIGKASTSSKSIANATRRRSAGRDSFVARADSLRET